METLDGDVVGDGSGGSQAEEGSVEDDVGVRLERATEECHGIERRTIRSKRPMEEGDSFGLRL